MALHNLKIWVINGGTQSGKGSQSGTPATEKMENINVGAENAVQEKVVGITHFATHAVANIAVGTAKNTFNYFKSDIGRKSGDSNYQDIVNRQFEIVGDIGSALGAAKSGALAGGSIAPGIGHMVGAIFGALSSLVNTGFKYAERERSYQYQLFKESTSQAYNLARANYTSTTGRVR